MPDIIEGYLQFWEKKNSAVIEDMKYSDIRLLADVLRVPESRIIEVMEDYMTKRSQIKMREEWKGIRDADK